MPELFTCPLVLKSQSPSTTSFTTSNQGTKLASESKLSPKQIQVRDKSIRRDEAEIDLGEVVDPPKSSAAEEQQRKDSGESDEDAAGDNGVYYTCR